MKNILIILVFALVLVTSQTINAQSPRDTLKQMVEQLQKAPADNALREKIIKLAQNIKPAPAIPDKAIEFDGRAQFAFKNAKLNANPETGFLAAAREYEKAIATAPWVLDYYFNLYVIYEKAGIYVEAKRNCEFYLIGLSDQDQIMDAKRLIAGVNFAIEQFSNENLSKRLDQPFRTDIAELSRGKRWFSGGRYENGRRDEYWIVSDGSTVNGVIVYWLNAQRLAEYVLGGHRLGSNEPLQKNPEVVIWQKLKRDPSVPNIFYNEDGQSYVFTDDGETVNTRSLGSKISYRRIQ